MLPARLRKGIAHAMSVPTSSLLERVLTAAAAVSPRAMRPQHASALVRRTAGFLAGSTPASAYLAILSRWTDAPEVLSACGFDFEMPPGCAAGSLTRSLMYFDAMMYLPDDILVKVDRASMAVSLEARVPLLDHRVFEFACRLPAPLGWNGRKRKHYLRQVLFRQVPPELFERPKAGFCVPLGGWLRGPLRLWAEDLLAESKIRSSGFLNPAPIRRKWNEFLAGTGNWEHDLWSVIMLQAWLDRAPHLPPPSIGGSVEREPLRS